MTAIMPDSQNTPDPARLAGSTTAPEPGDSDVRQLWQRRVGHAIQVLRFGVGYRELDPDDQRQVLDVAEAIKAAEAAVHAQYSGLAQLWKARAERIRRDLPPAGDVPIDVRGAWALEASAWDLAAVELHDLATGTVR